DVPGVEKLLGIEEDKLLSLDDVHRAGQVGFADPIAGLVLRGDIPIPRTTKSGALAFDRLETGTGIAGAARAGEVGFTEITGVETRAVSGALRSQLAEDILSEVISPEYIAIALPFASVGVRGLTGVAKLTRIAANLTIGTDIGVARGFPLLRPNTLRPVLRALTAVAKSPAALRNIPRVIKNNPVFQRGIEGLRSARASLAGRGLSHEEWVEAIGFNNRVRLNRVSKDLTQESLSGQKAVTSPENLPLRQAIEEDMTAGRGIEDIVENGLSIRPQQGPVSEGVAGFWRGDEGGGILGAPFRRMDDTGIVDRALTSASAGDYPSVSLRQMRRSTNNTLVTKLADEELGLATYTDLIELSKANRIDVKALAKMKKADLESLAQGILREDEILGA
ncbi:hypothetical protein LCGC14_2872330, partial [marine sediment metagenome]